MLLLTLDDAVKVAKRYIHDCEDDSVIDDETEEWLLRQDMEQKCYIGRPGDYYQRLSGLIMDINPSEISAQIEADYLRNWCHTMQVEMQMTLAQISQSGQKVGKWLEPPKERAGTVAGICSCCGWESHYYEDDVVENNYCPNCGATMEGVWYNDE